MLPPGEKNPNPRTILNHHRHEIRLEAKILIPQITMMWMGETWMMTTVQAAIKNTTATVAMKCNMSF
jgi:hypothetical protein